MKSEIDTLEKNVVDDDRTTIERTVLSEYKYGFVTDIEADEAPKGLNEDTIRFISAKKNEPQWMLEWRLKAYCYWCSLEGEAPKWANIKYPAINYQDIIYYSAPKQKVNPDNLDEIGMNGRDSGVESANDSGVGVGGIFYGTTFLNEQFKPFFWTPFGKGLLGTLSSAQKGTAYDINSIGQVVGYLDDGTGHRAMIWNGPVITDLNDLLPPLSEWILTDALGINDGGQIVGTGLFLGESRAWIMTPAYKTIKIPPIYWQIMFGFLGDSDGVHIVGPGGGGPGS